MASVAMWLSFDITEIADPGSRAFSLELEAVTLEGFVARKGQRIVAYINRCPHLGVSLNWAESGFLSYDEQFIQCAMHGALFTIEDGRCIWGPCLGETLEKLELDTTETGQIFINLKDEQGDIGCISSK